MEKQVLSIEQMQHLQELGLDTSDASMYWARVCHGSRINDNTKGKWFLSLQKTFQTCGFTRYETLPTYTLQDIIQKLPLSIKPISDAGTFYLNLYYHDLSWVVDYLNNEGDGSYFAISSDSIMSAAYNMLCWVIENGYLETNK